MRRLRAVVGCGFAVHTVRYVAGYSHVARLSGPCLMPVVGIWSVKCGVLSRGWKFRASAETWGRDISGGLLWCVGLCPRLLV